MREIKFRAWDKKEKCWVSGFAIHQSGMFSDWAGCKKINGQCVADADWKYQHEIPHIKVMQYTGLRDKNGKEIYEGDVLINPKGIRGEIKYVPEYAAFLAYWKHDGECGYDYLDKGILMKCEVIGNIYENPELLKGEETA